MKKNSHDLIILDLKMPKMDEMTLYRKIKGIYGTIIFCINTADKHYIQELQKDILDIKKLLYTNPSY